MNHLTDKSNTLQQAAALLHERGLYPAVAHSAYYSCYQLMMHIWLNSMKKTVSELTRQRSSHEFLIGEVEDFIKKSMRKDSRYDFRKFRVEIWKLKNLRTNADYRNAPFDMAESARALRLSSLIVPILKKY